MLSSWLIAILLISPFLYAGYVYNQLVKRRNQVREAWSGIDVQLKRRHNLIPNLVTTVKSYAHHEKDVLEEITELRSRISDPGNVKETGAKENNISKSLKTLLGLVEAYPELKADKNFLTLQNELVDIEDHLQYARRYYNGCVRELNNFVESFPSNLICRLFGARPEGFFEVRRATERLVPSVSISESTDANGE